MEQRSGRSQIVIAHRLSTVRRADRLIVLKDGVVAESGTHDQLLSGDVGVDKELVQRQLSGHVAGDLAP